MASSQTKAKIWTVENDRSSSRWDYLATEEPLEINLINPQGGKKTVAITMRTPGADFDLAMGFLYSEGVIKSKSDIAKITYCVSQETEQNYNIVNVTLGEGISGDLPSLDRHFFTNSACGVCGKLSIDSLKVRGYGAINQQLVITPEVIYSLPAQLAKAQGIFTSTGGLHAAGLFDSQGKLVKIREDVGRHNALDKLIGSALLAEEFPLDKAIVMVSGRSSYEILQKCIVARVPIICAVSAPSSLAVAMAQEFGITLIGFLREKRFNVYSGMERVRILDKD